MTFKQFLFYAIVAAVSGFLGSNLGVVLMCLLTIGSDKDDADARERMLDLAQRVCTIASAMESPFYSSEAVDDMIFDAAEYALAIKNEYDEHECMEAYHAN